MLVLLFGIYKLDEEDFSQKYQLWKLLHHIRTQIAAHAQKGV